MGGARALRWDADIGSLVGKAADLFAIGLGAPESPAPVADLPHKVSVLPAENASPTPGLTAV